jgi:hypothetical protein
VTTPKVVAGKASRKAVAALMLRALYAGAPANAETWNRAKSAVLKGGSK